MPKSLQELIVVNTLPPSLDGIGDYSFNLYKQLNENGHCIGIFSCENEKTKKFFAEFEHVFCLIKSWNINGLYKFYRFVHKKNITSLHIQYEPYSYNKYGLPLSFALLTIIFRVKGIFIHVNFHEIGVRFHNSGLKGFSRAFLQRLIAYVLAFTANSSQTSNAFYAGLLKPLRATVIPIPSNFEHIISQSVFNFFSRKKPFVISINANRCRQNCFEILSLLEKKFKFFFEVNIIGRAYPDDLNYIENQISINNLTIPIHLKVNCDEIVFISAMKESNIFLQLESNTNNRGGVSSKSGTTATAMLLGLPIVTTFGDMTDSTLFSNNYNIFFIEYIDPNIAANQIVNIASNFENLNIIGARAKDKYFEKFSWSQTLNYYNTMLA